MALSSDDLNDKLKKLKKFLRSNLDMAVVALVSMDGKLIASVSSASISKREEERIVSSMVERVFPLAEKSTQILMELKKGNFHGLYIETSDGYILVRQAEPNELLLISTRKMLKEFKWY